MDSAARTFPPSADSVGAARRFAVERLAPWGADAVEDDVRAVVSELATNAVLHARTPFTVALGVDGVRLRIAVTDGSAARPRLRRVQGGEATTGRGLAIVQLLATAWGVEQLADGKRTWAELRVGDGDGHGRGHDTATHGGDDLEALLARWSGDGGGVADRTRSGAA